MLTLIDLNYSRQVAPLISDELFEEMKKIIADKKQVLLYLNRRGEATSLYCRDCGNILKCEFCDVSLTIHRYPEKHLLCHLCNTAGPVPHNCSKCNGTNLVPVGVGVQKIEE
jgi:primosomal protein N' (replication factor Y)